MARPTKYDKEIKPYLDEIKAAVEAGATIEEISTAFNVAQSTIYKYKKEIKEFSEIFVRGRARIVFEIKAALLKKAVGFQYEEKKQYITQDENGNVKKHTEVLTRYCPPSETAAAMLLRNYADDWLDRDSISTEMKKQELELKKAIAESNNFDLNFDAK